MVPQKKTVDSLGSRTLFIRNVKTCLRSSFLRRNARSSALRPSVQYNSRSLAPLIVLETFPTILASNEGAGGRSRGAAGMSVLCEEEDDFLGLLGARALRGRIRSTMIRRGDSVAKPR